MLFYRVIKFRKKEIVLNSRAIPPSHKEEGRKERNRGRGMGEKEREGIISCRHNISSLAGSFSSLFLIF
jgi:hypothetical protein